MAFIDTNDVDVVLITETWFSDENDLALPGYTMYTANRPNGVRGGGVGIYIKNILSSQLLNHSQLTSTKLEQIWCKVN